MVRELKRPVPRRLPPVSPEESPVGPNTADNSGPLFPSRVHDNGSGSVSAPLCRSARGTYHLAMPDPLPTFVPMLSKSGGPGLPLSRRTD